MIDLSRPLTFDQCSVHFEPPDTIVVVAAGHMTAEIIEQVTAALVEHARGKPYVLYLLDMSRLESISTQSRKATEQSTLIHASRGMAIFGGSIVLRIIAGSVLRLHRLLHGRLSTDPVRSFDTEVHARDWIAKRRRQVRTELSLPDLADPPDNPGSSPG